ncbi:hypothetical protein GCM10010492_03550 [Saccharothrix mutabilis subsp. mutabilis]|uniref:Uncharacterized protein n=1 Tax=Saccharothrix mutabilis subsp. mutabilis TaxID=66855 RepID=A0ABP3CL88_9PSEU
MEITGVGTEVVVSGFGVWWLVAFVGKVRQMWPDAVVGDERLVDVDVSDLRLPDVEGAVSDVLPFARDAEMDRFWEENGYATMRDGEGPFAIFHRRQRYLDWEVNVLRAHDAFADNVHEMDDRRRLLIGDAVIVTIVTPEDPDVHPFSRRVVDLFLSCFTAEPGPSGA